MTVAQMILDFVAAVAWPLVVVVLVVILREQIRDLFKRMTSVTGPGGVGAGFAAPAAVALATVDIEPTATEPTSDAAPTVDSASGQPLEDRVTMTRDDLETLLRGFAESGWEASRTLKFRSEHPSPVIRWAADGHPFIAVWKGGSTDGDVRAMQKRITGMGGEVGDVLSRARQARARALAMSLDPSASPDEVARAEREATQTEAQAERSAHLFAEALGEMFPESDSAIERAFLDRFMKSLHAPPVSRDTPNG